MDAGATDFSLCCFSGPFLTSDTFSATKGSTSLSQQNEDKGFPHKKSISTTPSPEE